MSRNFEEELKVTTEEALEMRRREDIPVMECKPILKKQKMLSLLNEAKDGDLTNHQKSEIFALALIDLYKQSLPRGFS